MPRKHKKSRKAWEASRKAENRYGVSLRKLAGQVASIIHDFTQANRPDLGALESALIRYSEGVDGWARAVSDRMLAEVNLKDAKAFMAHSREMGKLLGKEIRNAPTGQIMQELQAEQVVLIKSLPLEASARVHELATTALTTGQRFDTLIKEIQGLGDITRNRATLIARTEVARASSNMTQARAQYVGSEEYFWRTAGDADVRKSHRKMNGRRIRWDSPPEVDPGKFYHAGCFPNCRCYAEPILPD